LRNTAVASSGLSAIPASSPVHPADRPAGFPPRPLPPGAQLAGDLPGPARPPPAGGLPPWCRPPRRRLHPARRPHQLPGRPGQQSRVREGRPRSPRSPSCPPAPGLCAATCPRQLGVLRPLPYPHWLLVQHAGLRCPYQVTRLPPAL